MNRLLRSALVAVLASAAPGACAPVLSGSRPAIEQDERDVLLAVIRHFQDRDPGAQKPVVQWFSMGPIRDNLLPRAQNLETAGIRFPMEVFPDLVRRSGTPVAVRSLIGDSTRARWLTPAQADSLKSARVQSITGVLVRLREMHPGAGFFTSLSRAGFDERRSHAAVAYASACGGLCGSAGVVLLERRRGRWRVLEQVPMLVS
jgi:hypothetical protein